MSDPEKSMEGGQPPEAEGVAPQQTGHVTKFRVVFSQVLAVTAKNLLLLDLGMAIAIPTIVLPPLMEGTDPEGLKFDDDQASWFGSVLYICQPLGSILSGIMLEPLGRKVSMIIVNVPHIVAWLLLAFANSTISLYLAIVLLGLGIGFMEAPIITYVGEISQPQLRGTLTSYSNLFATLGIALVYLLGSLVQWRTAAGICVSVPIITIIAISQVPETPMWLISRGRVEDAEKALRWLRGWTSRADVAAELAELENYSRRTKMKKKIKNKKAENGNIACYINHAVDLRPEQVTSSPAEKAHPEEDKRAEVEVFSWKERIKDFLRPQMTKPLSLLLGFFFISNMTGPVATRPYMVKLITDMKFPMEAYQANVVFGVLGFVASVACMVTVARLGRRLIGLSSTGVCAVAALLLASAGPHSPWFAFAMFILLTFATFYGCVGLVWTLVSEVLPFRGRSLASGISAAWSYALAFVATKTFLDLEARLGLYQVFYLYAAISAAGVIFLYFWLPETEGRSLEDIEVSYAKK